MGEGMEVEAGISKKVLRAQLTRMHLLPRTFMS